MELKDLVEEIKKLSLVEVSDLVKLLEENFDFRKTNDFNLEEICSCNSISKGKYLVLGDNRPISKDSRMIGLIDEKDILGKAVYRIWPISKFGNIYN